MDTEHNRILNELCMIRSLVSGDFAALALGVGDGRLFRWTLFSGNETERSETMTFRSGRGVGGLTIRIGRTIAWNETDEAMVHLYRECPLTLAERLRTSVTAPVVVQRESRGVILVGSRTGRLFSEEDIAAVTLAAQRIGKLMEDERF
ncbi:MULTISPECIES: GAF domain-containing protein [Paenibacillus]|uniref:GAF domain-containing protein n=1 Tax=Paenibacillus naphthalenovorans TaxID=162209 RepID=A0A0U2UGI1_9BACL|nr:MULTISPECIES: GAF domain-containing protein [Paenibacillus]ALS25144.1 GAF domain-containing protein [Paenibacillus naphthalenovorans]NTZ20070.1 GAF domain-containing protein [Paenibacillus sp. JMULE4]GCL73252.1 GAF domain-containing protein [Paenibacillus naphthalenovorans]